MKKSTAEYKRMKALAHKKIGNNIRDSGDSADDDSREGTKMTELEAAARAVVDRLFEVYQPEYVQKCVENEPDSLLGRTDRLRKALKSYGAVAPPPPQENKGDNMGKFRKKPVVIEAFQWTGDEHQTEDPEWICEMLRNGQAFFINGGTPTVTLVITTLEGKMTANLGDWIIQGVKGEVYPCKADIFEATYEKV